MSTHPLRFVGDDFAGDSYLVVSLARETGPFGGAGVDVGGVGVRG